MNNKKLGNAFEVELCKKLASEGFWVHFIYPDVTGAQPFDVIAVKDGKAYAIDCKTSANKMFPLSRLEDNQINAFEKWLRCGNTMPIVAIKHDGKIFMMPYSIVKEKKKVNLEDGTYEIFRKQ